MKVRRRLCCALACGLLVLPLVAQEPAAGGAMTMALTGDSIITQRLSPYREPEFLKLMELIRGADLAFTNIEMLFHDYEGYPSVTSGGTYMRADPALAKELAWAGFDLGSRANNHTGDYTIESLFTTDRALGAAGIVHAGTGENLQQAREPRYADSAGGRVALVSCASTFTPHSVAGVQRADVRGRPGLNPLRFDTRYIVDQATIDSLKALATRLGVGRGARTQAGGARHGCVGGRIPVRRGYGHDPRGPDHQGAGLPGEAPGVGDAAADVHRRPSPRNATIERRGLAPTAVHARAAPGLRMIVRAAATHATAVQRSPSTC